jgi:hypothetical protein
MRLNGWQRIRIVALVALVAGTNRRDRLGRTMKLLATVAAAFSLLTAAGAHATEDFCAVVLKPPAEVTRDRSYDHRVSSHCHANGPMFVGDPVDGPKVFDVWRSKGSL